MPFRGSCLCGAVVYEIDRLDSPIRTCYCRTCRKAHASAFNVSANVAREHFRWIAGEDKLTCFESTPGKFRRFCSVCGSHIVAEYPHKPHVALRVATLDDDPGSVPIERYWMADAVTWAEEHEHIASFPHWYPGR